MSDLNMGTLYDLNKNIMQTMPSPKWKDIDKKLRELEKWILDFDKTNYYMLLNNELRDYTIFRLTPRGENELDKAKMMVQDIVECMKNRSFEILAIDKEKEQSAYSIWVREKNNNKVYCYMLFSYDNGVLEYN